jgi:hypothetical protein
VVHNGNMVVEEPKICVSVNLVSMLTIILEASRALEYALRTEAESTFFCKAIESDAQVKSKKWAKIDYTSRKGEGRWKCADTQLFQ